MADGNPKPANPPRGQGGVQDARFDLKHHRLFRRALANGWNVSPAEKQKILQACLRVLNAPTRAVAKRRGRKDPNPTARERMNAARTLATLVGQDNVLYLECLKELHRRERDGIEALHPEAPPPAPIEPEPVPLVPAPADEPPKTNGSKELDPMVLQKLFNDRFAAVRS